MKTVTCCFNCLEQRIKSDFSNKLLFSYGISHSAFPFSSSALVQMANSNGEVSALDSQFILMQIPLQNNTCLSNYIDECIVDEKQSFEGSENNENDGTALSEVNRNEAKVSDVSIRMDVAEFSLDRSPCLRNADRKSCIDWVGCLNSICAHSSRLSCFRMITALAPFARIGLSSSSVFEELASDFSSGILEDHVLQSINLLIEGKASGRDAVNFFHLVGIPSFNEISVPGCLRHPNIAPVLGMLKKADYVYWVLPKTPYTLESFLHYCPNALKSEWHIRFLVYQLLSALVYLHDVGIPHGNICPSNVVVTDSYWSWLCMSDMPVSGSHISAKECECNPPGSSARIKCCLDGCSSQELFADLILSQSIDWHSQFVQWWNGELSNFEYLLILNRLAGRRWGDHTFHTVMPWVIDFSTKPAEDSDSGWRDLSKSKWRLAKGDEQLDFTYSTSEIPHHVSDECLSELAVCSYKARRLPLSILRLAVRSVYEPNEYPSNMQRLYQWTPDECIPEFYCDPQIFYSLHPGMTDLAVPSWAGSPEEFIKLHRDALESERVSHQIHHWIDITFGHKMSGQAAISAKNVMLSSAESSVPRSVGRRQLFTLPHPPRRVVTKRLNEVENGTHVPSENGYLQQLEEASIFAEHARDLSPQYCYDKFSAGDSCCLMSDKNISKPPIDVITNSYMPSSDINLTYLLEHIEVLDGSMGYQELLLWRQKSSSSTCLSEDLAKDIFSVGGVIAELYLQRPLFNSVSLGTYIQSEMLPASIHRLPSHARAVIEACIQKDWTRRPSAKSILESPYFPATVKSSYLFIAPLQLLANDGSRLKYAANFAKNGAFKAMGHFAAEMCAPNCLSLIMSAQSDTEAEWANILLKEFMKCLTPIAVKKLLMPIIQKILQTTGYSHLKVSLLQVSFVQELWNIIGKQTYLELLHPFVISNLYVAPHKSSAAVASVLLIGTSEELGVPITVNQTILPLIHCFGKGLCLDGIDVLVRIGGLFGDTFIAKQMLPLLKQVVHSCVTVSYTNRPEPVQSWSGLALIDCLTTLDGLVAFLPREVIVKELIEDRNCIHVMILMQSNFEIPVLQVAANTLIAICQRIGPEFAESYVLPQLKDLFNELAFSQETAGSSSISGRSLKISKSKADQETQIENRIDLVLLLYPSFASLLGIEKLRQGCATWLLLEQFLLRCHDWKWEHTRESSRSGSENITAKRSPLNKNSASEYSPAKLLLNGVGWSIPQSQGIRSSKNMMPQRRSDGLHQITSENHLATSHFLKREPWFWFPSPAASWDGPDFIGRVGSLKDELPWKIRASVIYSIRAHHGALRSLAVSQDEGMVFTAGIGPGFKGTVQKWDLSRINCVSGYYGHEEVVNDVCVLSSSGKIASCDGTIHVWNGRTGKVVSVFSEPSVDSSHIGSPSSSVSKINTDLPNLLNSTTMSGGLLANAFDGSLYTCMHHLESRQLLIAGTGNGCLRFIDIAQGQKLHLWKGEAVDSAFPYIVSALSSCGSDKSTMNGSSASSWIAAGLSSGHCRLFDLRSGNVIASWRAHDGYVTQLAAPEDHLLVSSSLDKSLRIWDLRRSWSAKPTIIKGHADGISGFSVWGQDIISIARNKIGLSTLSRSPDEDGQPQQIVPQKLYAAESGTKNMSVLSSINILPFSRLFVVGTEDGYLRICC